MVKHRNILGGFQARIDGSTPRTLEPSAMAARREPPRVSDAKICATKCPAFEGQSYSEEFKDANSVFLARCRELGGAIDQLTPDGIITICPVMEEMQEEA